MNTIPCTDCTHQSPYSCRRMHPSSPGLFQYTVRIDRFIANLYHVSTPDRRLHIGRPSVSSKASPSPWLRTAKSLTRNQLAEYCIIVLPSRRDVTIGWHPTFADRLVHYKVMCRGVLSRPTGHSCELYSKNNLLQFYGGKSIRLGYTAYNAGLRNVFTGTAT